MVKYLSTSDIRPKTNLIICLQIPILLILFLTGSVPDIKVIAGYNTLEGHGDIRIGEAFRQGSLQPSTTRRVR